MSLLDLLFISSLSISVTNCHVALTFPPARNLNLDFLDNIRYTDKVYYNFHTNFIYTEHLHHVVCQKEKVK